jgi:hypothetical protein
MWEFTKRVFAVGPTPMIVRVSEVGAGASALRGYMRNPAASSATPMTARTTGTRIFFRRDRVGLVAAGGLAATRTAQALSALPTAGGVLLSELWGRLSGSALLTVGSSGIWPSPLLTRLAA